MADRYTEVMGRIDAMLSRHRALPAAANRQEIDDLYTDACAMILTAEGERMEVDRELTAVLKGDVDDAEAIRHSRDLAQRRVVLDRDLAALRSIAAGLSTAAEWMRDPASGEVSELVGEGRVRASRPTRSSSPRTPSGA